MKTIWLHVVLSSVTITMWKGLVNIMNCSCGLLHFALQGSRKRRLCSCIWQNDIMQESCMIPIWHMWQEVGGRRWCEVAVCAAWVMGLYLNTWSIFYSSLLILVLITHFSVHCRQHVKLNRNVVISFAGINYVSCLAILYRMVRVLVILRALCTRLANATSWMGDNHMDYKLFWGKQSTIHCWTLYSVKDCCAHEQESTQVVHNFYEHIMKALLNRSALTRQVIHLI